MKSLFKNGVWAGLWLASAMGLQAVLLNDGKTVNRLVQIQNILNDANATVTLEPKLRSGRWPEGTLIMQQSADYTYPALLNAWYSDKFQPGGTEYTVSADFQPLESDGAWDGFGGVMGWLDIETGIGIALYVNAYEAFQVSTIAFKTDNEEENETAASLFNLDGSAALLDYGSAWSELGDYNKAGVATFELAFSLPTEDDKAALEGVTARITATVYQKINKKVVQVGNQVELLTTLPVPGDTLHQCGYFGYWGSLWEVGSTIGFYDNLKLEGDIYNYAPTIEPIDGLFTNEDIPIEEIKTTIYDKESASRDLTMTAESDNLDLVDADGIELTGIASARTLRIVPKANQSGNATIKITVSDGEKTTTTDFLLTVNAVNDTPTISSVGDQTIDEGSVTDAIAVTLGDIDNMASELALSVSSDNTVLIPEANVVMAGDGENRTVTITPADGAYGSATLTLTVSDGDATASGAFILTVNALNDAPVATPVDLQLEKGSSVRFTLQGQDAEGQSLKFKIVSKPENGRLLGRVPNLTYKPKTDFIGMDRFTFTVHDGELESEQATVTLTVAKAQEKPALSDITDVTTESGKPVTVSFTVQDADTPVYDLKLSAEAEEIPQVGDLDFQFGGEGESRTLTITPVAAQTSRVQIMVTVDDGTGTQTGWTKFWLTVTVPAGTKPKIHVKTADESKIMLTWKASAGFKLQTSSDLNSWSTLNYEGDSILIDPSEKMYFFRLFKE